MKILVTASLILASLGMMIADQTRPQQVKSADTGQTAISGYTHIGGLGCPGCGGDVQVKASEVIYPDLHKQTWGVQVTFVFANSPDVSAYLDESEIPDLLNRIDFLSKLSSPTPLKTFRAVYSTPGGFGVAIDGKSGKEPENFEIVYTQTSACSCNANLTRVAIFHFSDLATFRSLLVKVQNVIQAAKAH